MEPAGVYYCTLHSGIANEDNDRCDFFDPHNPENEVDEDGEPVACIFHACVYDPNSPLDRT